MTHGQAREARNLLRLSCPRLAMLSGVPSSAIERYEILGTMQGSAERIDRLRVFFEAAGVEFTNGDQPGVKLRQAES